MSLRLATERLEISPLVTADIPAFVAYRRVAEVARYQSWSPDYSLGDAESLVAAQPRSGIPAAGEWVQLAVRDRLAAGSAELVGDVAVGADVVQPDTYELGVTLDPQHQGNGYATEALGAVIQWLMAERSAHRIVMQGDARNTAVLALMRRLGLRHEGVILEGDWLKGEWTSLERFAVLRREWVAHSSSTS
ncbi:MAG: GNAT family N-acetyltransferase [Microbacterium sp.]|nr:GNAT family N-acetyltransferase [Microbacterium sp.]MBA4345278.1 GNAT family N-acetyltransferase [Microbacterium sp.]